MSDHLGPFTLTSLIGEGATARVWRAQHRRSGTSVAVKILRAKHGRIPENRELFLHEVKYLAGLNHPNIIRPIDYGVIQANGRMSATLQGLDGMPYCVLDHVAGGVCEIILGSSPGRP